MLRLTDWELEMYATVGTLRRAAYYLEERKLGNQEAIDLLRAKAWDVQDQVDGYHQMIGIN